MGMLTLRLDDELDAQLTREAERERKTRSELLREALAVFLSQRERQRFLDEIARAARELGSGEALAVAEEALPLDNEALRAAESQAAYRAPRTRKGRKR